VGATLSLGPVCYTQFISGAPPQLVPEGSPRGSHGKSSPSSIPSHCPRLHLSSSPSSGPRPVTQLLFPVLSHESLSLTPACAQCFTPAAPSSHPESVANFRRDGNPAKAPLAHLRVSAVPSSLTECRPRKSDSTLINLPECNS
jgi:hypothetical protein